MRVDFGKTADDYAKHRAGFPAALFDRLAQVGVGTPGQRVVDLGTGTGTLARGFALRGCKVTGIDLAEALAEKARQLDTKLGVQVEYRIAPAERTGLLDGSFDIVAAGQCWHWFDRGAVAREARRILVPGGRLVIAHFDWIPLAGNVVEMTERLIEKHNPAQPKPHVHFAGASGIYGLWLHDIAGAGFEKIESFSFDVRVVYSHEAWRGRIRASQGVGAMLSHEQVTAFDTEHATLLGERFPREPLSIPHRVFVVIGVVPE